MHLGATGRSGSHGSPSLAERCCWRTRVASSVMRAVASVGARTRACSPRERTYLSSPSRSVARTTTSAPWGRGGDGHGEEAGGEGRQLAGEADRHVDGRVEAVLPRPGGDPIVEAKVGWHLEVGGARAGGIDGEGADPVHVEDADVASQVAVAHECPQAAAERQAPGVDAPLGDGQGARREVLELDALSRVDGAPQRVEAGRELSCVGHRAEFEAHLGGGEGTLGEEADLPQRVGEILPAGEGTRGEGGRASGVQHGQLVWRQADLGEVVGVSVDDVALGGVIGGLEVGERNAQFEELGLVAFEFAIGGLVAASVVVGEGRRAPRPTTAASPRRATAPRGRAAVRSVP